LRAITENNYKEHRMPFLAPVFAGVGTAVLGAGGAAAAGATGTAIVGGLTSAAIVGGTAYGISSAVGGANEAKEERKRAAEREATMRGSLSAFALPETPSPVNAQQSAAEKLAKQRRMSMLSGGKTLLTTQAPNLNQTTGKTLLGS